MKEPKVPVAKEGVPFIAFAAFLSLIFAIIGFKAASLAGLALTAFVLYFFRDPQRIACDDEDALISPADGRVILIERVFDERYVKEHAYKVSIFMNIFSVHVNRVPFPGKVLKVIYKPGAFYSANTDKSSLGNESCAVVMETAAGKKIAVVQIAGLIARRIVCWAGRGDHLSKGERFGLIRFGSRVDLYLPLQTQLEIAKGQKVRAGATVLGYLS